MRVMPLLATLLAVAQSAWADPPRPADPVTVIRPATAAPAIVLPAEVKAEPGEFIALEAQAEGKVVRFVPLDPGLRMFPPALLASKKAAVFTATNPGKYRVLAYTAVGDEPSEPASCTVVVGTPPPTPPGPPVPPAPDNPPGPAPADPADLAWNFGLWVPSDGDRPRVGTTDPTLYQKFPQVQGRWDGRAAVNHEEAARQVLGDWLPAHAQRSGTCGGHAGAGGIDLLQCVLIGLGRRAAFRPSSHAWLYYLARREYGMLGRGDGVAGGSIPPMMAKYGVLHREEAGDPDKTGPAVDRVADAWGAGRIDRAEADRLARLASDNVATISAPVRSAAELADGIAAGGVGVCSDMQGYAMERDRDGFCRPQGTWAHYHVRSSVFSTPSGRKGFGYRQSWGRTVPSGPELAGHPGNCFGVDWDVQDRLCRSGEVHVVFAVPLWDEIPNLPWVF